MVKNHGELQVTITFKHTVTDSDLAALEFHGLTMEDILRGAEEDATSLLSFEDVEDLKATALYVKGEETNG